MRERERERESNGEENSSSSFGHFGNFILIVNYVILGIAITTILRKNSYSSF